MGPKWVALFLFPCCCVSAVAEAQSIELKFGGFAPTFESELWDDNLATFQIEPDDFSGFVAGAAVGLPLSDHLELVVAVDTSSTTVLSSYRDFVWDDGGEILQDLTLRVTPLTGGVRLYPLGQRARVRPFLTGGGAAYLYEYREEGEFVDFETFDIYSDTFIDRGAAYGWFFGGGVSIAWTDAVFVVGEYRRHWASGRHGVDFEGFGGFELTSQQVSAGVGFRF